MTNRYRPMQPHDLPSPLRREFLKDALRCLALPALSAPWLVACGGRNDPLAPTPRLASVENFRDVAGADDATAYRTLSGQRLRRGVIYRSNVLEPSAADMATLDTLGITTVYDLRTPGEIEQQADHPPAGANESPVNLLGTEDNPTPALSSVADAVAWMESSYRTFVTNPLTRQRLAEVLESLAATPGPQLYHCSGGKDRTGWVTAVLLTVLDIPQNVILQNYMLTNSYSAPSIRAFYQAMIASHGKAYADIYLQVLVAHETYLHAAYDQALASYGSMTGYIRDGIGLDAATETRLRLRLLT